MKYASPVPMSKLPGGHRCAASAHLSRALLVSALGLAVAGISAPAAAADETSYVEDLQVRYVYLDRQQLVAEGYKICRHVSVGNASSTVVPVVVKDLGVSVPIAADIVATAVVELGC